MAKLPMALTLAIWAGAATLAQAQTLAEGAKDIDPSDTAVTERSISELNPETSEQDPSDTTAIREGDEAKGGEDKSAEMNATIKTGEPDANIRILIESLEPTLSIQSNYGAPFALEIVQPAFSKAYLTDYNHATELPALFADKSTELSDDAKKALVPLGHALRSKALKDHAYLIGVHTDAGGDAVYNDQLSYFRAEAIKAFLVDAFAIEDNRLVTVGWGERKLKYPQSPMSPANQRVDVSLITDGLESLPDGQSITLWTFKGKDRRFVLNARDARARYPDFGHFGYQMSGAMVDVSNTDCQRKIAHDPRPEVHRLDDFNTGRTPLKCETGEAPLSYGARRIIIR